VQLACSERDFEAVAMHHVRDVTFTEDASRIRAGHGLANMAT
jgi:predicted transposase YbfD/YdcC